MGSDAEPELLGGNWKVTEVFSSLAGRIIRKVGVSCASTTLFLIYSGDAQCVGARAVHWLCGIIRRRDSDGSKF